MTYGEAVNDPTTVLGRAAAQSLTDAQERYSRASDLASANDTTVKEELVAMWSIQLSAA